MSRVFDAVCFDFAGTLFDDRDLRSVHLQQLRFVADAAGAPAASDQEVRAAYRQGMGASFRALGGRTSYLHRELFGGAFVGMAAALGGTIDEATAQEAVDRQYRATIDHAVLRPDALATLEALRALGCHVQIVSNIDEEQLAPMVERFGLGELVDVAISSEAAGFCKPDRRIFELALANAGAAPARTLFVGDSPGHDVAGPAALGIRTAWLDAARKGDPGPVRPDHTIHSLSQVPDLTQESGAESGRSGVHSPPQNAGGAR
jgi:HAD superfamily hydrolase (TIGR01509 family)